MNMNNVIVDLSLQCEKWRDALPDYEQIIQNSLQQIIENVPEGKILDKFSHLEISIVLCDDEYISHLNKNFRSQDKATNVLSFQGIETDQIKNYLSKTEDIPDYPQILGEIYIAYETMINEAQAASLALRDHFYHLNLHGLLHLLGYDHIEDNDAKVMEALETKLLAKLAVDDPYGA